VGSGLTALAIRIHKELIQTIKNFSQSVLPPGHKKIIKKEASALAVLVALGGFGFFFYFCS
jgi:hypothetical protein